MAESGKTFWHTAPGVITAVAALITALGGVLAILVQNGIVGRSGETGGQVVASTPAVGAANHAATGGTPDSQIAAASTVPWATATATLLRRDGSSATVRAPTVGLACSTESLEFKNGQRISLDRVRSIRFDAIYMENGSADGVVTLLDGRTLTDPIHTWNCPITGASELGPLEIQLREIRGIDFHH